MACSLVLGFLSAGGWSAPPENIDPKPAQAEKKPKPKFPISKETTYVTGPCDEDGYIDYAAALQKRLSQSITPANNANVLLWRAFGPHPEGAKMPADFFKWMGIKEPPEPGEYFIPLSLYRKDHLKVDLLKDGKTLDDELQHCVQRPWTAKEHPNIAAWLKANEKPLALVIEATKRPHFYSPLVPNKKGKGSSGLVGALMPGVQKCRELASALTARAMLEVGEGRPDDAWQDLLACHRLGRLVMRGSTIIMGLVGISLDTLAGKADLAFLAGAKLSARQIQDCLRDLQKLPPLSSMADKVDLGERFVTLDAFIMLDRDGAKALEKDAGGSSSVFEDAIAKIFQPHIDWEPALRNANRCYDRMAKAMRVKDRATRGKELDRIDKELEALNKKARDSGMSLLKILLAPDTSKMIGEKVGNILLHLMVPAVRKVQDAADRTEQLQQNLYLAFALAAYHRDHGRYPAELDALAPKYLAKIPQDMFNDKALTYRPTENGYLLYSVGVNGQDERGQSYEDDPRGDDLAVRMPLPQIPRK
jgi:hypothetical protein